MDDVDDESVSGERGVEVDLPENWGRKYSPEGRPYYFNVETDDTTWFLEDIDLETGELVSCIFFGLDGRGSLLTFIISSVKRFHPHHAHPYLFHLSQRPLYRLLAPQDHPSFQEDSLGRTIG